MDKVVSPIRDGLTAPFNPSPMGILHAYKTKGSSGSGTSVPGKHEYVNVQYKQTETVYEQMEYTSQETAPPQRPPLPEFAQPKSTREETANYMEIKPAHATPPPAATEDYMQFAPGKSVEISSGDYMSHRPVQTTDENYMDLQPGNNTAQLCTKQTMSDIEQGQCQSSCMDFQPPTKCTKQQPDMSDYMDIQPGGKNCVKPDHDMSDYMDIQLGRKHCAQKERDRSDYMDIRPARKHCVKSDQEPSAYMDICPSKKVSMQKLDKLEAQDGAVKRLDISDYMDFAPGRQVEPSLAANTTVSRASQPPAASSLLTNENLAATTKPSATKPLSSIDASSVTAESSKEDADHKPMLLNYATLDLGDSVPATGDDDKYSCHGNSNSDSKSALQTGLVARHTYAEIDFEKSQHLLQDVTRLETEAPFDCL